MTEPTALLTIIVPTFRRSANLAVLLRALHREVAPLDGRVAVLVSDNASPDDTPAVTAAAQAAWPALAVQRHATNLGPDENFCSAVDRVESRWFWIIGDDDLPRPGTVARLLDLLQAESPALVHLASHWMDDVTQDRGEIAGPLHVQMLDAAAFARRVHVWTTFISGIVVDRTRLAAGLGGESIRRFHGTFLGQLAWVFPVMTTPGACFAVVSDTCVLATTDNSGQYPLLTVFGARFAQLAHAVFGRGSRVDRALVDGNLLHYMPGRVWAERAAPSGRYQHEEPWPALRRELGDRPLFWLLLAPLVRWPMWLAQPVYQAWRVFHRIDRALQARRARTPVRA